MLNLVDPDLAASNPDPATALAWVMQIQNGPITLARSRYTEDSLEDAIRKGVRQYVILGAGFDTFVYRRPDLTGRLQVFELDHPATQALKRERVSILGWGHPANLHSVSIDFTRESLTDALRRSSYDPNQLSFFSWLGVSFYLTHTVVFNTLQSMASIATRGSTLVFDYMDAEAFIPEKAGKRVQTMQWIAEQVGEPMKAGFDSLALAANVRRLGLRLEENLDPAAIEARYFQDRADRYHAFEHVHIARAVAD
jgi:methyltransferase (TIGR00027 family)